MDIGDRSWMYLSRSANEYENRAKDFLNKAFERASLGNEILCPCRLYFNRYWHYRDVVEDHLFGHRFSPNYTQWVFHGEGISSTNIPHPSHEGHEGVSQGLSDHKHDDIDKLLHDTFRNEGKQDLYPGCKSFSKLSFTIRLYLFKCIHGLSNVAFSDLLDLIKEAFPFAQIPESFHKARKVIRDLSLNYEKIHACPNDCMLFWNDNANLDNCVVCGSSRWKNVLDELTNKTSKVPAKVLRIKDGNLRHPADGKAWQHFDSMYPDFAKHIPNVRLGLLSDGFNPFRTMSISHSTWPVMLMNYNLSPWICVKPEYIMLSMIIPGPSSPGNDIDIYLQPLIAELNELWKVGVETFDVETNQTFNMRLALLWMVSDFPALAMLSG
ncbi:hypothetical protein P3L10_021482 [Capsicum annuum]|uniref:uncharacterized protein LOC124885881 n=1 Tax=Capsicum annuum TaxID=4072 RepID=UPI001FB1591D|nr:uncharacterized protein LOC124885881 [Capsicum annuum]